MSSDTDQKERTTRNPAAANDSSSRMDRITDHTKGLVDDVKEWVDLRVRLVQLDLEERFETIANQTILTIVVIGIGALSLLFALIAAALALGTLFSKPALGFLAVSVSLAILMWGFNRWRPRFVNAAILTAARRGQEVVRKDALREAESDIKALNAPSPSATVQKDKEKETDTNEQ